MKKLKIYSIVPPFKSLEIKESDKEKYLNCKFWKESHSEARQFHCYYEPQMPRRADKAINILSGAYLNKDSCNDDIDNEATAAWNCETQLMHKSNCNICKGQKYRKLVKELYKEGVHFFIDKTIDDAIITAEKNNLIKPNILNRTKDMINNARFPIVHTLNNENIDVYKPILMELECIYYDDAKNLLFPDHDLFSELQEAYENKMIYGYASDDKKIYYFNTGSLIKWLMKNGYFPCELIKDFHDLKITSIKENSHKHPSTLTSLHRLEKEDTDIDNIFNQAADGTIRMYIKHDRKFLQFEKEVLDYKGIIAEKRYEGFSQLRLRKEDCVYQNQFGGLTVDMLLYNEKPKNLCKYVDCTIELVPTAEEVEYKLRPCVKTDRHKAEELFDRKNIYVDLNEIDSLNENPDVDLEETDKESEPSVKEAWISVLKNMSECNIKLKPKNIWNELRNGTQCLAKTGIEIIKIDSWSKYLSKDPTLTFKHEAGGEEITWMKKSFQTNMGAFKRELA